MNVVPTDFGNKLDRTQAAFLVLSGAIHALPVLLFYLSFAGDVDVGSVARFSGTTFEIEALPTRDASSPTREPPDTAPSRVQPDSSALGEPSAEPERDPERTSTPTIVPDSAPSVSSTASSATEKASPETPTVREPVQTGQSTAAISPKQVVSDAAASPLPAAGSYGQEDVPSGVVDLRVGFLKTLPLAAKSDPAWLELPMGPVGTIDVEVHVGSDFRLGPVKVIEHPGQDIPQPLRRMVRINRNFLLRGRFAVDTTGKHGTQRLRVTARVIQTDADADTPEAQGVNRLGQIGGTNPTGAYFTYYSGRRIEFVVSRF